MYDTEYVIYRSGYEELCYLPAKEWDRYVRDTSDTVCVEISRGHTLTEAINLTELVLKQTEMEQ